jgi:hypothetical protein
MKCRPDSSLAQATSLPRPYLRPALEQRVERLERIVEKLQTLWNAQPGPDEWRSTIGMFAGDSIAKVIIDAALQARADERKQAAR